MDRHAIDLHFPSLDAEDSAEGIAGLLFFSVFSTHVEKLFPFRNPGEVLYWIVRIAENGSWVAKVSLINRSDLESPVFKKHQAIIPQACCPEIISPGGVARCGFTRDKIYTVSKFAPMVVRELKKTLT